MIHRVPYFGSRVLYTKQAIRDILLKHKQYIHEHGMDMPMITDLRWGQLSSVPGQTSSTEGNNV